MKRIFLPILFFISLNTYAQVSLIDGTTSYSEDFNTLASSGSGLTWSNNLTIANVFEGNAVNPQLSTYTTGTGSATGGGIYSYGAAPSLGDRALGGLVVNATGAIHYGLLLQNDNTNGKTIESIQLAYTGEQWRNANANQDKLTFSYRKSSTPITELLTGTYTNDNLFDFTSPVTTSTVGAVDGNVNSVTVSGTLTINLAPGEQIMLRWTDANESGNDDGLAIDDISISTIVLPIKLTNFDINKQSININEIDWATTSEINNAYFNIEHATDGVNFEVIGNVKGNGTSNKRNNYSFTHKNVPSGLNYYRLTQVDYDGRSETFDVKSIDMGRTGLVRAYPSVTSDYITIDNPEGLFMGLYDADGKLQIEVKDENKIDLSNLVSGIYFLKSQTETIKIRKI